MTPNRLEHDVDVETYRLQTHLQNLLKGTHLVPTQLDHIAGGALAKLLMREHVVQMSNSMSSSSSMHRI